MHLNVTKKNESSSHVLLLVEEKVLQLQYCKTFTMATRVVTKTGHRLIV